MKLEHWKQNTPQDQYVAIISALDGTMSNWEDKIIGDIKLRNYRDMYLNELILVAPYLIGDIKW